MGQGSNNFSEIFKSQDISSTIEHVMGVAQGKPDALPELLKDAGKILSAVSQKFTPKQMVMAVGGLAVAAIVVISLTETGNGHDDNNDQNRNQGQQNKQNQGYN
jgi:hypothetical protein